MPRYLAGRSKTRLHVQETGQCPFGSDGHYAHSSSELVNVDISAKFVTRAVDSDDSESMISTETAESRDIRNGTRYCSMH